MAVKVAVDPPEPLAGVDPAFAAVVMRCLEKQAEARYQTIGELAAALAPLGGEESHAAATMIARMSGSRTVPPSPTAQRSTLALPRRRVWPLALGALVIAAGAAIGAVAVTRATHHHRVRTRDAAVAVVPVDAAPPPIDAAENHDVRDMLKDLADDQEYDAILRLAARAKGDPEAEAVVADARAKYIAAQLAAIDGEAKIGACKKAKELADDAVALVPDEPSLAAAAAKCKVRVNEPAETAQSLMKKAGDAFGKHDYAQALALAAKVLDRDKANEGALRLATLATCSLHDATKARGFFARLNEADGNYALAYCRKEGIVPSGEPTTGRADDLEKAVAAFQRGDLRTASKTVDEILKSAPRYAAALTLGGIIACRNHNEAKARSYLERLGPRKRRALLAGCEQAGVPLR
jgi:tetratricopeptide (TPR) repeat protein